MPPPEPAIAASRALCDAGAALLVNWLIVGEKHRDEMSVSTLKCIKNYSKRLKPQMLVAVNFWYDVSRVAYPIEEGNPQ
jgi:hypothetical protein